MDYEEQPNSQKYVEVHIYFPQTCKEPYKMSINDAKQSNYIATQVTYFENDNFDYIEIVVPDTLYNEVRKVDLNKFIDLWIGESSLYNHEIEDNHIYNYKSIAKVVSSLCMKKDLTFVQLLEDYYKGYIYDI